MPLCSLAMLLISSWMRTVLPTPAPPNKPIFPPLAYGQRRSMTLMPVSRMSLETFCSEKDGAGRWIGSCSSLEKSPPRSSIGSPRTLNMRPKVHGPTGTLIGASVSMASMPRSTPSVAPMATLLTVSSPMCCMTSQVSVLPSLRVILRAVKRAGRCLSGKRTSMTGPTAWTTLPISSFSFMLASPPCYSWAFAPPTTSVIS